MESIHQKINELTRDLKIVINDLNQLLNSQSAPVSKTKKQKRKVIDITKQLVEECLKEENIDTN